MLVVVHTATAAAECVPVTIDATRTAQPIAKLVFGGFMEPATTRVWAEMLSDRKFFNEISSKPQPTATTGGFGRRGPQPRWKPVGADEYEPQAPHTITLPPTSISVYEFEVRQ